MAREIEDEKPGISVFLSTKIGGPTYELLVKMLEDEVHRWITSDDGQTVIRKVASESVKGLVERQFGYYTSDDPRSKKLREKLTDVLFDHLNKRVGVDEKLEP